MNKEYSFCNDVKREIYHVTKKSLVDIADTFFPFRGHKF